MIMAFNTINGISVVLRQTSCDRMKCRDTPRGCLVSNRRLKLDGLVGADLSRTSPMYRPSVGIPVSSLFCETA